MIKRKKKEIIMHDLINVIASNHAMVQLKRKDYATAVIECRDAIRDALKRGDIKDGDYKTLLEMIGETFEIGEPK
jgi:hypothetical protein